MIWDSSHKYHFFMRREIFTVIFPRCKFPSYRWISLENYRYYGENTFSKKKLQLVENYESYLRILQSVPIVLPHTLVVLSSARFRFYDSKSLGGKSCAWKWVRISRHAVEVSDENSCEIRRYLEKHVTLKTMNMSWKNFFIVRFVHSNTNKVGLRFVGCNVSGPKVRHPTKILAISSAEFYLRWKLHQCHEFWKAIKVL